MYRLTVGFVASGKNFGINTFHYVMDDAGFSSQFAAAQALVNAWQTTILPVYQDCFAEDVTINILTAKRVSSGGGPSAAGIVSVVGTIAQVALTAAIAACIKWICPDPDNRMGHSFMGGVPEGGIESDNFQALYITPILTWIGAMTVNLAVGAVNAVFSKYDRKTGLHYPISDGQLNPKASGFNKRTLPVS